MEQSKRPEYIESAFKDRAMLGRVAAYYLLMSSVSALGMLFALSVEVVTKTTVLGEEIRQLEYSGNWILAIAVAIAVFMQGYVISSIVSGLSSLVSNLAVIREKLSQGS